MQVYNAALHVRRGLLALPAIGSKEGTPPRSFLIEEVRGLHRELRLLVIVVAEACIARALLYKPAEQNAILFEVRRALTYALVSRGCVLNLILVQLNRFKIAHTAGYHAGGIG